MLRYNRLDSNRKEWTKDFNTQKIVFHCKTYQTAHNLCIINCSLKTNVCLIICILLKSSDKYKMIHGVNFCFQVKEIKLSTWKKASFVEPCGFWFHKKMVNISSTYRGASLCSSGWNIFVRFRKNWWHYIKEWEFFFLGMETRWQEDR